MTETALPPFSLPYETRRHIGRRINEARNFRGLTPEAIESALNLRPGLVTELEDSDGPVRAEHLYLLITHLHIGVRFLHDGAPPRIAAVILKTLSSGCEHGSLSEIATLLECLSSVE